MRCPLASRDAGSPGQRVEFGMAEGRRGPQALQVRLLESPPSAVEAARRPAEDLHSLIEDMIKLLETRVQPDLRRGRYPDRRAHGQARRRRRARGGAGPGRRASCVRSFAAPALRGRCHGLARTPSWPAPGSGGASAAGWLTRRVPDPSRASAAAGSLRRRVRRSHVAAGGGGGRAPGLFADPTVASPGAGSLRGAPGPCESHPAPARTGPQPVAFSIQLARIGNSISPVSALACGGGPYCCTCAVTSASVGVGSCRV